MSQEGNLYSDSSFTLFSIKMLEQQWSVKVSQQGILSGRRILHRSSNLAIVILFVKKSECELYLTSMVVYVSK